MRFIAYIPIVLILLSGCSMDEQLLSVLKVEEEDFTIIAYEETIISTKETQVQEILRRENWGKSKLDLEKAGYPDYKFFFNKHINKIGTKIVVYSVWINQDSEILKLTKDDGSKYVHLDRDDSEVILGFIRNYEN